MQKLQVPDRRPGARGCAAPQVAGEEAKYRVRVGRAEEFTGPYSDKKGWPLYLGGGSLTIEDDGPFIGTGHNDIFSEEGIDWLAHRAKDSERDYRPFLNIGRLECDDGKWSSVCR
jgi:arabinan endo-1,5-alpha-L-arabinosidase